MKVICFTPDTLHVFDDSIIKNVFFLEMTGVEYEAEVRPHMQPDLLPLMQSIRGSDDDARVYIFLTLDYNYTTEKYDLRVWPGFRAWSGSAMNRYTRVFLHREIVTLTDILYFYVAR